MAVAIRAENVTIRYITGDFKDIGIKEYTMRRMTGNYHVKEFMAVDGVSFELDKGEMLGIIGSNGAGKSTLLKAISGIMEPTRGHIEVHGEVAALLELGSGFDGDLTVKENAYLRGAMLGYTQEFMDRTYDSIIDFAELREFEDRPFKQLSSGMKSRLAFSIASLVSPDVLILDEVLSVGDGAFQEKSAKKMREIISGGATTILVSHSLDQIRELCTKVLWLDHGRQVAFGETREICDAYERFLRGEPVNSVTDGLNQSVAAVVPEEQNTTAEPTIPNEDTVVRTQEKEQRIGNWRKAGLVIGLVFSLLATVACMLVGMLSTQILHNEPIAIHAVDGSGTVRFRGAAVDGVWYNTTDIVLSSGNWIADESAFILEATDETPLFVQMPMGLSRTLTFDVGTDKGRVVVADNGSSMELDLYTEFEVELGLPFELGPNTVNPAKQYVVEHIVFFGLLTFFIGMLFAMHLLRGKAVYRRQMGAAKNGAIEALRFLFIICVCIHHYCGYCPAGYLGVDFSFVLSGFLLMSHFNHQRDRSDVAAVEAAKYARSRYFRLIPPYLFAFVLTMVVFFCLNRPVSVLDFMSKGIWELLLLEGAGLSTGLVVGPGWFCTALFLAGFVIYFLLCKSKETYLYFIAPLTFVLIFSYMFQTIGHLNRWDQIGALRGFAEMGLGCVCFQTYESFGPRVKERWRFASSVLELFCISYLLYVIIFIGSSVADFGCVLVIAVLITSLFIGNSYLSQAMNQPSYAYLGKISMGIYLNHIAISLVDWGTLFPIPWVWSLPLYLLFVVLFSCVSTELVDLLVSAVKRNRLRAAGELKAE